jgi:hypothetical protein
MSDTAQAPSRGTEPSGLPRYALAGYLHALGGILILAIAGFLYAMSRR